MIGESKYQPLQEYLENSNAAETTLTFTEIEEIIGNTLPDSARTKKQWWGNRNKGALQADSWMKAGYVVKKINLDEKKVTFGKPVTTYKVEPVKDTVKWNSESIKALRQKMGLTQSEFAMELGVRQQTVSEWENGVYEPRRMASKYLSKVAENVESNNKTEY
ncbi:XRE family transcriptional regulator [Calothrix sp. NIES-4071]|nr:XRE family transcriptional regulator [Calothrix sp. NIES-4071]BAZ62270.1 XRE family transcriptional regulator [Calothrix sp. NIES-4105]